MAIYQLAMIEFDTEQYKEAREEFRKILAHYPDSPVAGEASYMLGEWELVNDDIRAALREFRRTLRFYDDEQIIARAFYKIGWCY